MTTPMCTTLYCPHPGVVPGIFRYEEDPDDVRDHHVTYCRECARAMHADGYFTPANEDDIADTPELSEEELAIVERFETAPPVCLSCDEAEDRIARVLDLADELDGRVRVLERAAYTSDFVQGQMDAYRELAARARRAIEGAAA